MVRYSEPFLLSSTGSTRATAYGFSNKSVTVGGKTHVVWLDAVAQVCGRTYDHGSGTWSGTCRLFEGCDNHTSPTLALARDGRLHIVFGPHGWWGNWNQGRFRWAVSAQPGRIDAWTQQQDFGYNATYASVAHTPAGIDVVVYRGGEPPASLMFQKQRPKGGWTTAREIMRQDIAPQYSHVGATVACDSDGTLYVAGHFYHEGPDPAGGPDEGRSHGVAVVRSSDLGETWSDMRGEPVAIPCLYEDRIAIPPVGADLRMNGLALDSRGDLWALTSSVDAQTRHVFLSRWAGEDWETVDLQAHLPADRVAVDAALTMDTKDRIHVLVTGVRPSAPADEPSRAWGHPSLEVFHMVSADGARTFECHMVSTPDDSLANWLPNISHKGVCQPVEKPVILYTHGEPGLGCSPPTHTEVYCVMVEEVA